MENGVGGAYRLWHCDFLELEWTQAVRDERCWSVLRIAVDFEILEDYEKNNSHSKGYI